MTGFDLPPDVRARTAPRVRDQDPPPNVFDRVLDEEERQQSLRLRQSFSLATGANPDVAGEAQSLGQRLGVDSLVGERNIDDLRRIGEETKLADLSPSLRRQLLDQEFARIAHDDLDNLNLLEDLASKVIEAPGEFLSMAKVFMGQGEKADTRRVITILGRFLAEKTTAERGALGAGIIAGGFTEQDREAMERLDRRRAKLPHSSPGLVSGLAGMLGQLSQTMPVIAGTAAAGALVGAATGPGALVLGGAAGTAAIFSTSAIIEGGNQTLDLIAEGVDPGLARAIGAGVGGINGFLEVVGFRFLSAAARKLIRESVTKGVVQGLTRMTVRSATTRAAGSYGLALGGEVGTELAQELVNVGGEIAGGVGPEDLGEVFDRLGHIVAETVAGTAILAGIGPVAQFAADTTRAEAAQQAQVLFEELSAGVQDSKVRGRNQRAFAQFLQSALDGTPGENLYIRPEKLQEALQSVGIERARLVDELPNVQQQLERAMDSGADVVIPTADYQALVAGTPLDGVLRPHLRLDPDAMSLEESQVFFQGPQDEARQNAERIVQETVARNEEVERQADKVETDILGQLTETGLFRRKQAQALATVHRAVVMNLATREGITVEQFQARFPLRVRRGRKSDVLGPRFEQKEEAQPAEVAETEEGELITEVPTQPPAREQLVQEGGELGIEAERRVEERRAEDVGPPEGVEERRVAEEERRAAPSPVRQMVQEGGDLGIEGETVSEFVERMTGRETEQAEGEREGPLLQQGQQGPRGAFDPSNFTMTLLEKAGVSSFLHESAHYYFTVLAQIASSQTGPTQVRADVEAFLKMVDVDSLDQFTAMTLNQQRKAHEAFALSFEDYMHSGKAPSADLERVFERFRRWLRVIYKAVRDRLNAIFRREFGEDLPILTPEFRAIFDRLLASDEAIEHAEAVRSLAPHFQTQEEARATDDEWSRYVQTLSDSHEGAVTKLLKAMLGNAQWLSGARSRVEKENQAKHDELREEIRKDEAETVRVMPVYRAIHFLRRGEFIDELGEVEPGPDNSRLNTEDARSMLPEGATLRNLSGMTNKVGLPPDVVARTFGFGSGQEMVAEIVEAVPQAELVTERTDDRMLAENGDMLDAEAVEEAIQSALHNEAHGRAVATEWKFLSGATQPVRVIRAAARRAARDALSQTPVNQIRHRTFVAAEARARREAMDASRRQEPQLAIRKKREELLQREMAAESLKIQEEIRKVLDLRTGRLQGPLRRVSVADEKLVKTRDIDLVRAARSVLASVGVFPRPETSQQKQLTREALETVREQHPGVFNGVLAIQQELGGTDLREATLEEFRDVIEVVQSLWELSVKTKTFEVAGRRMKQAEARELLAAQLATLPELTGFPVLGGRKVPEGQSPSYASRKIQKFWQTVPALKRFQHYSLFLDDGKPDGPFQTIVQRPMFAAVNLLLGTKLGLTQRLRDQMKEVLKDAGPWWDQAIQAKPKELPNPDNPRVGFVFRGKRELLDVILDMGNPSNLTKRLVGEGWVDNPNTTGGELDTSGWDRFIKRMWDEGIINQTDLDFIQLVGELFEELRPLSQATQREVFGVEFEELEIGTVTLPSGEQVKGWYAPLRPDRLRAKLPQTRTFQDLESLEGLEQEYQYSAQPIGPGRGFTISRNPNYFDRLSMDIGRRLSAFDEELRFIFLMPHTKAMVRLFVHDREMGQVMTDYDPEAVRGIILPWLRTTSRQVVSEPGNNPAIDGAARLLRAGTGVAYLGWNLGTTLVQNTGFASSLTQVKPKYLMAGFKTFRQGPLSAWKDAMEGNPRMRERFSQHGQRMWDYLSRQGRGPIERLFSVTKTEGTRIAFLPIRFMQSIVDIITWHGAYQQAIAESSDTADMNRLQQDSIQKANDAVERSQGSSRPESLAPFEVGTPIQKSYTQFLNFSNGILNQILAPRTVRGKLGLLMSLPLAIGFFETFLRALANGLPEDEDGDGILDDLAMELGTNYLRNVAGLIPVFGPMLLAFSQGEGDRLSTAPAGSAMRLAWDGVSSFFDEQDIDARDTKNIGIMLTLITGGIPIAPIADRLSYIQAVEEGSIDPTSEWDFMRGLLTGRSSEASRR